MNPSKLIIASARLPVRLTQSEQGWSAEASPGGLATALRTLAEHRPFTWIGWPGIQVPSHEHDTVRNLLNEGGHGVPVFLNDEEYEGFYEEFSNRLLWPLFHNLPASAFTDHIWWIYQRVNEQFADRIAEQAEPGDTVWVHDYQLALVPQMLREREVECSIGYFLHIPFPSDETYRALPVREQLLHGLLGADLLGFHTYEYVSHFRDACLRVLGLESEPEWIRVPSHNARLGVLPIGIDPDELLELSETPAAKEQRARLDDRYHDLSVVLGVDRLDYTKGLPQKLLGFETMLSNRPDLHEKVVLIQVAAPSRTGVTEYQELKRELDELVGRINGAFGALDWTPVVYINRTVSRDRLTALYQRAEVALVTPLRDGMNLVSLEYIAARQEPGSLILSEFAGAASCLPGAVRVNPHNTAHIAHALETVLDEGPDIEGFEQNRDFVLRNTSVAWAERFLSRLEQGSRSSHGVPERLHVTRPDLAERLRAAQRPLVLLDYDGTLVPHTDLPARAVPTSRLRRLLTAMGRVATVYVVSGRPAADLNRWLGDLHIGLVSEHGLSLRPAGGRWEPLIEPDVSALWEVVEPILEDFRERTPGAHIERKQASIAWHYRTADPELGSELTRELRSALENVLRGQALNVLAGSKVLEVRPIEMSKRNVAQHLLERHAQADFVLCAGNDRTDEEMFEAVLARDDLDSLVCHVGHVNTMAPYRIASPASLLAQLEDIVAIWAARTE